MPSAPKSPVQKKTGAPKAKGAVRAKSGCYTCRIRRKKCDERPNHNNACETCVRLRLECLGFGAKRPEWLRESSKVSDLREKIKNFLASQGMIKGHSGSGPRGSEAEPVILRLNEQDYSSSSESPQSNILTLSSSAEDFRPLHHTSAIRDENWSNAPSFGPTTPPQLRHSPSPYTNYNNSGMPYTFDPNPDNASNSLVPWNPTSASSFSTLYHLTIDPTEYMDDAIYPTGRSFSPYDIVPDVLLEHYKKNVVGVQYLLADSADFYSVILSTVDNDGPSREGARLLAQIHTIRSQAPGQPALLSETVKEKYDMLKIILNQKHFNDNDAMASLHLISSFLFDGGAGEWEEWLKVACSYCEQLLAKYNGIVATLSNCNDQERFLLKTTIWFDVLASITTLKSPRLLLPIRELCSPNVSRVYDPTITGTPSKLSMMPVMGCENSVVWALAETSALSAWKRSQEAQGCLSMPELVTKGMEIGHYLTSSPPSLLQTAMIQTPVEELRRSTAEIFHASARIYLASVVSGDHVSVQEIAGAVDDLMDCVQRIPPAPDSRSAVVRSTVFPFFICGCFTDNQGYRRTITDHLGSGEGPGNCYTVQGMLKEMWGSRRKRSEPVPWRKMLHEGKLLLV